MLPHIGIDATTSHRVRTSRDPVTPRLPRRRRVPTPGLRRGDRTPTASPPASSPTHHTPARGVENTGDARHECNGEVLDRARGCLGHRRREADRTVTRKHDAGGAHGLGSASLRRGSADRSHRRATRNRRIRKQLVDVGGRDRRRERDDLLGASCAPCARSVRRHAAHSGLARCAISRSGRLLREYTPHADRRRSGRSSSSTDRPPLYLFAVQTRLGPLEVDSSASSVDFIKVCPEHASPRACPQGDPLLARVVADRAGPGEVAGRPASSRCAPARRSRRATPVAAPTRSEHSRSRDRRQRAPPAPRGDRGDRLVGARASPNTAASAWGVPKSSSIAARNSPRRRIGVGRPVDPLPSPSRPVEASTAFCVVETRSPELDRPAVVRLQDREPERARSYGSSASADRRSCRATSPSSRRCVSPCRVQPVAGEGVARALGLARSFSWCGNTRSSPPPWRSKPSPRSSSDIAEHSMCQPGRPGPHGESHAARPASPPSRARSRPGCASARRPRPARRPTRGARRACGAAARRTRERRRRRSTRPALDDVRGPRSTSSPMSSSIWSMYSVACGIASGRRTPSRSISAQ